MVSIGREAVSAEAICYAARASRGEVDEIDGHARIRTGRALHFANFMGTGANFVKLADLDPAGGDVRPPLALGIEFVNSVVRLVRIESQCDRRARIEADGSELRFWRVMGRFLH